MASHRLRPLTLASLLALSLGACTQWSRRPPPAPGEDRFFAGPVRVTRADGVPFLLDNVTVGADSVVGRETVEPRRRIALPVSDVRSVEARATNPLATAAVVVLSVAAAIGVWGAVAIATIGTGS